MFSRLIFHDALTTSVAVLLCHDMYITLRLWCHLSVKHTVKFVQVLDLNATCGCTVIMVYWAGRTTDL